MTNMRALVYRGLGDVGLETVTKPRVGSGDVLVKVKSAAVCASDIRVFKGEKKASDVPQSRQEKSAKPKVPQHPNTCADRKTPLLA